MSAGTLPGRLIPFVRRKDRPVCVMVPGAGGGLGPYLRLASFLGATHNVYAVRSTGLLPGEEPEESIPTMAATVLATLDDAGITPELVFGWSQGGVVAWEVCADLAARGSTPDLVVVDSSPEPWRSTVERDGAIRDVIVAQLGARPAPETVDRLVRTFEAHVRALSGHRVERPYDGRVLLLLCDEEGVPPEEAERWHSLAKHLDRGTLRAGHFEVFDPEHLPELTAAIGGFLGREEGR
ncbi:alpha/beta fold hydrolase [Saccharothrix sp.]|uniref:alpha/beta fold hydrolase n=1 Tax=Saccharothrix sp. TaxID=1873460 RepID=UPI002810A238|nr:alpha/beta fold hydrolase [Saccharothrix sp.]